MTHVKNVFNTENNEFQRLQEKAKASSQKVLDFALRAGRALSARRARRVGSFSYLADTADLQSAAAEKFHGAGQKFYGAADFQSAAAEKSHGAVQKFHGAAEL